jgi:outer membrane protein assembly factor BamB
VEQDTSPLTTRNVQLLKLVADITLSATGSAESLPVITNGYAYVGTGDSDKITGVHGGTLYKIDLKAAQIVRTFHVPLFNVGGDWGLGMGSAPAVVGGKVYISALDGVVYCLDADTLVSLWSTDLLHPNPGKGQYLDNSNPPAACWTSPLVIDVPSAPATSRRVYVGVGQGDTRPGAFGVVYCLDANTGNVIWMFCTNQVDEGQPNRPNYVPPRTPPAGPRLRSLFSLRSSFTTRIPAASGYLYGLRALTITP